MYWRPWEIQLYHSSMHCPSCARLEYHVKVPWRPRYVALIKFALIHFYRIYFWHGSTMYCSWPCLFTVDHGYTHLRKILYIWPCLTSRCFSNSCIHKPSFSIMPWSLKSISTKSITIKEKSMYFGPRHSFEPHTLVGIY